MSGFRPVVGVIDDDSSVRSALMRLFRTVGFEISVYETAEEYLSQSDRGDVECLVIDVRLPGMSGLELLAQVQSDARSAHHRKKDKLVCERRWPTGRREWPCPALPAD